MSNNVKYKNNHKAVLALSLMLLGLMWPQTVLAVKYNPESDYISADEIMPDPFENFNRKMHNLNVVLYKTVLNPVSGAYKTIVPEWGRDRVRDFTQNLKTPVYMLNNIFQGNIPGAVNCFWRFVVNTGLGVGGVIDIATSAGIASHREDFGRTLAVYGGKHGAYLVLPLLGPSSVRDFSGDVVDTIIDPFSQTLHKNLLLGKTALEVVGQYTDSQDLINNVNNNSLDSYTTFRSLYVQHRTQRIELEREDDIFLKTRQKK